MLEKISKGIDFFSVSWFQRMLTELSVVSRSILPVYTKYCDSFQWAEEQFELIVLDDIIL